MTALSIKNKLKATAYLVTTKTKKTDDDGEDGHNTGLR